MGKIPDKSEPGSASFYGTESTLDEVLKRYAVHPARSEFYRKTKQRFLSTVKSAIKENDLVLDIGCSFGLVTCEIAQMYREQGLSATVIGIDIDPRQIDNAREYAVRQDIAGVEFYVCDAAGIRDLMEEDRVSLFTSLYSFHHIPDAGRDDLHAHKRDVLRMMAGIAEDDANLVIGDVSVPSSYSDVQRYRTDTRQLWMPPRLAAADRVSFEAKSMEMNACVGVILRENEYPITVGEFLELFNDTGWNVVSKQTVRPHAYRDVVLHCRR